VCFHPFTSYLKSYCPPSFSSYRRIRPISRPCAKFLEALFLRFYWDIASRFPTNKMGIAPVVCPCPSQYICSYDFASYVGVHKKLLSTCWGYLTAAFSSIRQPEHAVRCDMGPICHAWVGFCCWQHSVTWAVQTDLYFIDLVPYGTRVLQLPHRMTFMFSHLFVCSMILLFRLNMLSKTCKPVICTFLFDFCPYLHRFVFFSTKTTIFSVHGCFEFGGNWRVKLR
jgi:hypothetical protein